ncbi:MAG: SIMPL domain-containing protein [Actinobacteria bacterium]|nr:SIMPL domain-containing protein [Actinomycetota bacterium]
MTIGVLGQTGKDRFMKVITRFVPRFLLTALVLATLLAIALPAGAQENLNTVTVSAMKQVDIEADIARATFGVRSKDVSAKVATSELSERTRSVLDALKDVGFTSDELSTGEVRLYRTCIARCRDSNRRDGIAPDRVMGYVGSAVVRLETKKLDRLGVAVDAAVAGGAKSIRNISYDVENKDAAVLEALRQAMRFAKAKAQVIAEEAGRELGPAVIVTEGRTSAPERYSLTSDLQASTIESAGGAAGSIPFPVEPPTLNASARVTVTWELL